MEGGVSAASSAGGASDNGVVVFNPFEGLPPTPRSEEDDIRKGIFSRVLRLLHTVDDDERTRWRKSIEEVVLAKQSTSQVDSGKKLRSQRDAECASDIEVVGKGCDDAVAPEPSVGVKRPREDEGGSAMTTMDEGLGDKPCVKTKEKREEESVQGHHDCSDRDYIAAYLRTLLDKVIGLSLQELHIDALRILCLMVGIPPSSSRSKMVHYSKLASFYYTNCEKLGKRVSKSFHVVEQFKRDEEMRQKIFSQSSTSHASSGGASSKSASSKRPPKTATVGTRQKGPIEHQGSAAVVASASSTSDSGVTRKRGVKARTTGGEPAKVALDDNAGCPVNEELEVRRQGKVFTASTNSYDPLAPASSGGDGVVAAEEVWTATKLEGAVASIIHLHDPVTTAIVVRKLAQMGYRSSTVEQAVEVILQRFHDRQFIFYDNGMAFLL